MPKFGEDSAASCAALNIGTRDQASFCDEAFAALVNRHSQFVFRVAFSVLRNVQDAEDIAQETFFKLYRLGSWNNLKDERAFLARAAWRLAVTRVKRFGDERFSERASDCSPSVENVLIQEDADALLHRLIDALPQELRLPLALATVDEMKSPEIAKVMSIPEGTVRNRLLRARELLKRKLEESEVRRG